MAITTSANGSMSGSLGGGRRTLQRTIVNVDPKSIKEMFKLVRELKQIDPNLAAELRHKFRESARNVANDARRRAPVKTGALRKSIKPVITSRGQAGVKVSDESARINEFGGRHPFFGNTDIWFAQKAHPYINPAVAAYQDNFMRDCIAAYNQAIVKAGF